MMRAFLVALALGVAPPAFAQAQAQAQSAAPARPSAVDPARKAVGLRIAGRLLPDGTYEKMLGGSMNQLMQSMIGDSFDLPIRSIAAIGGMSEQQVKALGPGTLKELAQIIDPAFDQRMRITMQVMMGGMGRFFTQFEPSLRDGMAEVFAARFTDAQLREIDAFYASPTGSLLASQYMTMMADPAMMSRMQGIMPKMMQAMPAMLAEAGKATAHLPKPRKPEDLSAAEKKRMAELLGIDPAKVK